MLHVFLTCGITMQQNLSFKTKQNRSHQNKPIRVYMCLSSLWTSTNGICGYGLVEIRMVLGLWTMKAFFNLDDPVDLRFCLMVAKKRKKIAISKLGDYFGVYFEFRNLSSNGSCFIVLHKSLWAIILFIEITYSHIHLTAIINDVNHKNIEAVLCLALMKRKKHQNHISVLYWFSN